jgi:hypothetical protein
LDPDITFLKQVLNANLFAQELSVVLDYERISVNASQALTEANKMGPCLEPWNEAVESCFVYVLILSFDQSIPHYSMAQLFHTFQLPNYSPLGSPYIQRRSRSCHPGAKDFEVVYSPGSPYIQRLYLHPTYSTFYRPHSSFPTQVTHNAIVFHTNSQQLAFFNSKVSANRNRSSVRKLDSRTSQSWVEWVLGDVHVPEYLWFQ